MNESYKELLVKKERDMKQTLLRVAPSLGFSTIYL